MNEPNDPSTVIILNVPKLLANRADELVERLTDLFDPNEFSVVVMFNKEANDITADWINKPILVQSEEEFDRLSNEFSVIERYIDLHTKKLQKQMNEADD